MEHALTVELERPLSALDSSLHQLNTSASGDIPTVDIHDIRTRRENRRREKERADHEAAVAQDAASKAAAEEAELERQRGWQREMEAAEEARMERMAAREAKLEADTRAREATEAAWKAEEEATEAARLVAEQAAEKEKARREGLLRDEWALYEAAAGEKLAQDLAELAATFDHREVQLLRDEVAHEGGVVSRTVKHAKGSQRALVAQTKGRFNLHSVLLLHHTFGKSTRPEPPFSPRLIV